MEKRWRYAREARTQRGDEEITGKGERKRKGGIERKREKKRKMQYILGVVKRVGGYGALEFLLV